MGTPRNGAMAGPGPAHRQHADPGHVSGGSPGCVAEHPTAGLPGGPIAPPGVDLGVGDKEEAQARRPDPMEMMAINVDYGKTQEDMAIYGNKRWYMAVKSVLSRNEPQQHRDVTNKR